MESGVKEYIHTSMYLVRTAIWIVHIRYSNELGFGTIGHADHQLGWIRSPKICFRRFRETPNNSKFSAQRLVQNAKTINSASLKTKVCGKDLQNMLLVSDLSCHLGMGGTHSYFNSS